jgi:hypothetical protein
LDSTALRHNRFLRSLHQWRTAQINDHDPDSLASAGYRSEWRKHVALTAGRDAIVKERRTYWLIRNGEFSFRIQNDTGQPARQSATLDLVSTSGTPTLIGFSPLAGESGAYVFRVATGTPEPVAAASIESSYQWLDSILLTEDDLELIDMSHAGPFRASRQEFVAASVTQPLRELCLSVSFPLGYYPEEKHVEVHHQRIPSGATIKDEALRSRIQFTGHTILLTVPYPLMGYRYAIAWKPVPARSRSARSKNFQQRCCKTDMGDRLVASFIEGLKDCVWIAQSSVALYVPEPDHGSRGRFLRRAGFPWSRWIA